MTSTRKVNISYDRKLQRAEEIVTIEITKKRKYFLQSKSKQARKFIFSLKVKIVELYYRWKLGNTKYALKTKITRVRGCPIDRT